MPADFLVCTGWWCDEDQKTEDRKETFGDSNLRKKDFHKLWHDSVRRVAPTQPILIFDSASPIKPDLHPGETLVSARKNFGHSANTAHHFSGVMTCFVNTLMYAYSNEFDYYVYVEQDALLFGDDMIDYCIKRMRKPYMFGAGYPSQQS
jgi:hypothetical protein